MIQKIKALLIDDETASHKVMAKLLGAYCPEVTITGAADSADGAYAAVINEMPDLVFLDIQMPQSDGFSFLKRFGVIPFEVIFVTSFNQFAINAIRFSALDYLLKPVEVADLQQAVSRAVATIESKRSSSPQVVNLINDLSGNPDGRKIGIHLADRVRFISHSEIVYIQAAGSYCEIHMLDGERLVMPRYLKDFEAYFGAASPFVRIGKSHIINIRHIHTYSKGESCIVEMSTGMFFEISRRRKQEVLERLRL